MGDCYISCTVGGVLDEASGSDSSTELLAVSLQLGGNANIDPCHRIEMVGCELRN